MSIRQEIRDIWETKTKVDNASVWMGNRVRLSRNIENIPFSSQASSAQKQAIVERLYKAFAPILPLDECVELRWSDCNSNEKELLKNLFYLDFPCDETVIWYHPKQHVQVIANNGDHVQLQLTLSRLQLKTMWKKLDALDSLLEQNLTYAFDPTWGYFTSNPHDLGCGLVAETYLHLPALCFLKKLPTLLEATQELQLSLLPAHLDKDKIMGHLFFLSNLDALGGDENTLLDHVNNMAQRLCQLEHRAREVVAKDNITLLQDGISRSLGLLGRCYEISYEESMNLLSIVLMAIDMGFISNKKRRAVLRLWQSMSSVCLKEFFSKDVLTIDKVRADVLRAYFSKIDDPFFLKVKGGSYVS